MTLSARILLFITCAFPALSAFVPINTNSPTAVTLFQAGATIEGFDSLTGAPTLTDGTLIPAGSQLDNQLKGTKGVFFTSGGNTPAAVLDVSGIGTAHSPTNVLAPLAINTEELCATNSSCFIEVFFTGNINKVGAWFENGDATMFIFWTDSTQEKLDVTKGNFVGGVDTAKKVDHVLLLVTNGGPLTIDDLTFAGSSAPPAVPEPSTAAITAMATAALLIYRRRTRIS